MSVGFKPESKVLPAFQTARKQDGKKDFPGFVNMGFTLLLVVFLVITLVVFALLALSGARNDLAFSRQLALQKQNYYTACSQSEALLQKVDQAVFRAKLRGIRPNFDGLPVKRSQDTVSWEIPVDDHRILCGEYSLRTRKITRWQVTASEAWNSDDSVSVWMP